MSGPDPFSLQFSTLNCVELGRNPMRCEKGGNFKTSRYLCKQCIERWFYSRYDQYFCLSHGMFSDLNVSKSWFQPSYHMWTASVGSVPWLADAKSYFLNWCFNGKRRATFECKQALAKAAAATNDIFKIDFVEPSAACACHIASVWRRKWEASLEWWPIPRLLQWTSPSGTCYSQVFIILYCVMEVHGSRSQLSIARTLQGFDSHVLKGPFISTNTHLVSFYSKPTELFPS